MRCPRPALVLPEAEYRCMFLPLAPYDEFCLTTDRCVIYGPICLVVRWPNRPQRP